MEKRILANKIITPDGTELISKHGHDYVSYKDKNDKWYSVDGGTNYLKRSFDVPDYTEASVYDDGLHTTRRENLRWGVNYTKKMEKLPQTEWRLIKDLDTEHIQAILDGNYSRGNEFYTQVFKDELEFRKSNK